MATDDRAEHDQNLPELAESPVRDARPDAADRKREREALRAKQRAEALRANLKRRRASLRTGNDSSS